MIPSRHVFRGVVPSVSSRTRSRYITALPRSTVSCSILARNQGSMLRRPSLPFSIHNGQTKRNECCWKCGNRRASTQTSSAETGSSRGESTVMGDGKTGHIVTGENEAIVFFDNLFPLRLTSLLWYSDGGDLSELLKRYKNSSLSAWDPIRTLKRATPEEIIKVKEIIPRFKDGGAFVKFELPDGQSAREIEEKLANYLQDQSIKPWFSPFRGVRVSLVKGVPWLEDLYRLPRNRLRVEFTGPELAQETLYGLFRKYGKISEIISQPSDSKVLPKYAYVDFKNVRDAIMARNCLHGLKVTAESDDSPQPSTKLRLSCERRKKSHPAWDWLTNHPRIVIPLLVALATAVTVAIFDPIREFFVKTHIQKSFRLSNNRLYKWFMQQTSDILAFRKRKSEEAGLNALFTHRKDLIESIQGWLLETADTFIVVHGPRGSGKKELIIDQVLDGRGNVLVLDCKPIVEARGEAGTIKKLAAEVGYRPIFSWANSLSSMIDLAVQSATGVKAGFSENLETQVIKILQATALAAKKVALRSRKKDDADANLSEDAYLETHPERRPVIVINNFLHRSEDSSLLHDKIAEWAATLVQNNVAHVVFLTTDTSYSKSLSKSLPDRVFHQVALGDLSPDVAKKFVISQLDPSDKPEREDTTDKDVQVVALSEKCRQQDISELDGVIGVLGGRLTDLQLLARRLKIGQSPAKAVSEIIDQSASEILRMLLSPGTSSTNGDRKWSVEQAWYLIKEIAAKESLRYNEVLLNPIFASSATPEAALEALAAAELITVRSAANGRPQTVRPGKPVYQAAFSTLLGDIVLRAKLDLSLLEELSRVETKTIDKCETELAVLGSLPRQPSETTGRITYLLQKLQTSQLRIVEYEKKKGALKKILAQEA